MKPSAYVSDLNEQLTYLFAFCRAVNELDFAAAMFNEFRGEQGSGWSTTETAYQIFAELKSLGSRTTPLDIAEYRQLLCLYAQLSEAGGVYEGLLNLMGVVQLKPYNLWPFQDMVRVRSTQRKVIGPNANAMFRRLAETATAIGMTKLSDLLARTFDDDVRNGMFHADYIIRPDGLRLRRRNGGQPYLISHGDLGELVTIGASFFDLFTHMQRNAMQTFRPAKRIVGRLSLNPPMAWTVELEEAGAFSIRGEGVGPEVDAAYERQHTINSYLVGKVLALYFDAEEALTLAQEAVKSCGFDAAAVVLGSSELAELGARIERRGLWVPSSAHEAPERGLMATPFGFLRWTGTDCLARVLPPVDEVEFG